MTVTRANTRLRIAVQKSGRLADKSLNLLRQCGLEFDLRKDRLFIEAANFPVDLLLVRDDDIPEYVVDGVCDLGIVGANVLEEKLPPLLASEGTQAPRTTRTLGFGYCRLAIATPEGTSITNPRDLQGKRIATSHPQILTAYLARHEVKAKIIEVSGSVEIAPTLKLADAVCDLVSTGSTLRSNGLREMVTIFESRSLLIETGTAMHSDTRATYEALLRRIDGVLRAENAKYIMMNAPTEALVAIKGILPGMEEPSVMPLGTDGKRIAIHAVSPEEIFWETMEKLKAAGASSILVLPIEKIIA